MKKIVTVWVAIKELTVEKICTREQMSTPALRWHIRSSSQFHLPILTPTTVSES